MIEPAGIRGNSTRFPEIARGGVARPGLAMPASLNGMSETAEPIAVYLAELPRAG